MVANTTDRLDLSDATRESSRSNRRWAGLWAIVVVTGVLYGSLLPFSIDLSSLSLSNGLGLFSIAWKATTSEDLITNILIYVPVGFFLVLSQSSKRGRGAAVAMAATGVGAVVSMFAESIQTAIAIRVASWLDVVLNGTGTACGAILALAARRYASVLLNWGRGCINSYPMAAIAGAVAIGLTVFHLSPFDFVRSTAELHASFGRADLGFGSGGASWSAGLADLVSSVCHATWFAVLGYFLALARRESGRDIWSALGTSAMQGCAVVFFIQFMQLFLRSHVFEAMDLLIWSVAVLMGAWMALIVVDAPSRSIWRYRPGLAVPTALLAFLACCHVLVLVGSALFDGGLLGQTGGVEVVLKPPFEALWRGSMVGAAFSMVSTAMEYGVLMLAVGVCLRRVAFRRAWLISGALCTLVSLLSESAALFSSSGSPDLTMPILALLSAVAVVPAYTALRPVAVGAR